VGFRHFSDRAVERLDWKVFGKPRVCMDKVQDVVRAKNNIILTTNSNSNSNLLSFTSHAKYSRYSVCSMTMNPTHPLFINAVLHFKPLDLSTLISTYKHTDADTYRKTLTLGLSSVYCCSMRFRIQQGRKFLLKLS